MPILPKNFSSWYFAFTFWCNALGCIKPMFELCMSGVFQFVMWKTFNLSNYLYIWSHFLVIVCGDWMVLHALYTCIICIFYFHIGVLCGINMLLRFGLFFFDWLFSSFTCILFWWCCWICVGCCHIYMHMFFCCNFFLLYSIIKDLYDKTFLNHPWH